MTRELLARLPRLKHIAQTGRSTHHIDVAACTARGITVSAGSHASPHTIAEFTLGVDPGVAARYTRALRLDETRRVDIPLGCGLHGKTLGIHGYGKIGSLVVHTGKSFGMRVLAWGGDASRRRALEAGCEFAASKQSSCYAQSDVLSVQSAVVRRNPPFDHRG